MPSDENKRKRKLFRDDGDFIRNAHLDWFVDSTPSQMAEGFKQAAGYVVDACVVHERHHDKFLYPVAALYRHSLELHLKNIIRVEHKVQHGAPQALGHDLSKLWQKARDVITRFWPETTENDFAPVTVAINEFSHLDSDGQGFRYFLNPQGNRNLTNAPRVISLDVLRHEMDEVLEWLSGCELGIEEFIDAQLEIEHELNDQYGDCAG